MKEEAGQERQRLKELLEGIKEKRQEIFAQAEEKARKAVQKLEEELKEWVRRRKRREKTLQPSRLRAAIERRFRRSRRNFFHPLGRKGPSAIAGWLEGGRSC